MNNGYYNRTQNGTEVSKIETKYNNKVNNISKSTVGFVKNPYLVEDEDVLFHINLSNKTDDLESMFHDVKVVCMGGTPSRMKNLAYFLIKELGIELPPGSDLLDLSASGHRYAMYKVGCVLCVSHGIGIPSITILLHELIKLMDYAKVQDPIFIRTGTSGGIDIQAGSVVIASETLNDYAEPYMEVPSLGKLIKLPAVIDKNLVNDLKQIAKETCNFPVLVGPTISNLHFYESTAMKNSAICENTDKDRREYYNKLKSMNIVNMDMEAVALVAITHKVGIKSAVINVVVNDSFTDSEDSPTKEIYMDWQKRPQKIVAEYIKQYVLS